MQFLHDTARVVHGDLKSNNILLCVAPTSPYGRTAKVADFGLAKVYEAGETHKSTKTLGTVSSNTLSCSFPCGLLDTETSVRCLLGWTLDIAPRQSLLRGCSGFFLECICVTFSAPLHLGSTALQISHMAPELLRFGKASAAADVYSMGIMMWEVSKLCRPYASPRPGVHNTGRLPLSV